VVEPRREADRLMGHVLATDRGGVATRRRDPIDPALARRFLGLVGRRTRREPLQYLVGEQEFFGLALRVDPRALIPRPETELLVSRVLALGLPQGARVADLGTGSGCIAIALAASREDLRLFALDRSARAIELAGENAERCSVAERITFVIGDFAGPPPQWHGRLDAVVANPPYVSEEEWKLLSPEVRDHEPREALVPGPRGTEAYRALAPAAVRLLRPGGWLVLELGYRSEAPAREALVPHGYDAVEVFPDLRGIPRVLQARRSA